MIQEPRQFPWERLRARAAQRPSEGSNEGEWVLNKVFVAGALPNRGLLPKKQVLQVLLCMQEVCTDRLFSESLKQGPIVPD